MAVTFGKNPMFGGFAGPFRGEVDIRDCEVEGEIPIAINGASGSSRATRPLDRHVRQVRRASCACVDRSYAADMSTRT